MTAPGQVDPFPQLDCVDCDHDIDGHDYGICAVAGCACAREVFEDD